MRYAALFAVVLLVLAGFSGVLSAQVAVPSDASASVDAFGLDAFGGWLLSAGRLYVTQLPGGSWREVTPPLATGAILGAAAFAGASGWAVSSDPGSPAAVTVWRTTDGGMTWSSDPVQLYSHGDPPPAGRFHLEFIDEKTGWLVVEHITSANFSSGDLFATNDGGLTWTQRTLPIGDPVHFTNALEGSVTGGPAGDETYRTADGGRTWEALPQAAIAGVDPEVRWVRGAAGKVGWRVERTGSCTGEGATRTCRLTDRLLATTDGGRNWTALELPAAPSGATLPNGPGPGSTAAYGGPAEYDPAVLGDLQRSHTELVQGQGFDKCEVATLSQLTDWYRNSPYRSVNLYIGGSMRYCSNNALTAAYLRQVQNIGWRFIPTWVGKQAPCYNTSRPKISEDPETAFLQGLEEANWAADRLWELGLTDEEGAGGVVYYDMENYAVSNSKCHIGVQNFITGWSAQMRARGNVAGVYTNSWIFKYYANLAAPPDAIWAADPDETVSRYSAGASVWNLYGLDNTLWANHQRIRQYVMGHNETWGSTTLNIDSDALDGVVGRVGPAMTATPTRTPTVTLTPSATPTLPIFTPVAWQHLPLILQ